MPYFEDPLSCLHDRGRSFYPNSHRFVDRRSGSKKIALPFILPFGETAMSIFRFLAIRALKMLSKHPNEIIEFYEKSAKFILFRHLFFVV